MLQSCLINETTEEAGKMPALPKPPGWHATLGVLYVKPVKTYAVFPSICGSVRSTASKPTATASIT